MRNRILRCLTIALATIWSSCLDNSTLGFGGNSGTVCPRPGADIICGGINATTANYAAEQIDGIWNDAFSFSPSHCNVGNVNILWQAFPSNQHPAYAQALYKLKEGRIEQIGLSWIMHGFTTVPDNTCGCGCNGQSGAALGVGCSDINSPNRTGFQSTLGPRWQINAHAGKFPAGGPANPPFSGTTTRRLRVKSADLEPSSADVKYFAEYSYICAQDAAAGHQNNNATYRQATIAGGPNEFAVAMSGTIQREKQAIRAWGASDPSVVETDIQFPAEGLFILAAKATHMSGNVWNYEYALANMNSDVSGQAFSVPLSPGAVVTNIGFHDVDYHSGDAMDNFTDPNLNFSGQDWQVTISNNAIQWSSETFAQNINANALRWGTMYNFRFNVNRAPAPRGGNITLTTYKVVNTVDAASVVPGPSSCPADISPIDRPDGFANVDDLLAVINSWGPCVPGNCAADTNGDGWVNVDDLLAVINGWGPCS